MTKEVKMADQGRRGLVGQMMELLSELPPIPAIGGTCKDQTKDGNVATAADRRARLALRIAILQHNRLAPSIVVEEEATTVADEPEPTCEPQPEPVEPPPPPAPPPRKPAKVSMSTVRLEDAAFLLAAAATPPEPEAVPAFKSALPVTEIPAASGALPPSKPAGSGVKDLQNIMSAFSAMEDPAPSSEPKEPQVEDADAGDPPKPAPSVSKGKRRSGSVSALDGLANAAAALSALQMSDPEEPDQPPTASPSDSSIEDAFAALRNAD